MPGRSPEAESSGQATRFYRHRRSDVGYRPRDAQRGGTRPEEKTSQEGASYSGRNRDRAIRRYRRRGGTDQKANSQETTSKELSYLVIYIQPACSTFL